MKISLKNFKCWKSKVIVIDDEGIQLLSGESGKGKSSVLDAIYFCLYGDMQKIVTHGEKGCQVELEYNDIKVTRSRRPNRLVVVRKSLETEVLEDDIAQVFINNTFGHHFSQTSYIRQNILENFIFMSPTEKLEFLEDSILKKFDIDGIKSRVQNHIKKIDQDINIKSGQYSTYKEIFEKNQIPQKVDFPINTTEKNRETVIKNEYTKVHNYGVLIKKYSKKIAESRDSAEKSKNLEKGIDSLIIRISELVEQKKELMNKKDLLKSDIDLDILVDTLRRFELHSAYLVISKNLEEEKKVYQDKLREEINTTTESIKKVDKSEARELETSIEKLKTHIKHYSRIMQIHEKLKKIPKNVDVTQEQIDDLLQSNTILQNSLDLYENTLTCPCCDNRVLYRNSRLEKYVTGEISSGLEYTERINKNKIEILRLKECLKNKETRDRLHQELSTLPNIDIEVSKDKLVLEYEKLKKKYDTVVETLNENRRLKKLLESRDFPSLSRSKQLIERFEKQLKNTPRQENTEELEGVDKEKLRGNIEKIQSDSRLKKEYIGQICNIEKKLVTLNEELQESRFQLSTIEIPSISGLENKLEITRDQLDVALKNIEKIEKWKVYRKEIETYTELKENLERLNLDLTNLRKELGLCQKFKNAIVKSETVSIQQFITTINSHVQIYLDHFFKNDQLLVKIETHRQLKSSKVTKSQITLNMEYGGHPVDLSNLSGGELSRLNLAFVLALSEIFQSPILMLDESMSTLDPDNCCNVLETVREHYKGKLVLMVHHQITEGLFDKVIPL